MSKGVRLSKRTSGPWTNFESFLLKEGNYHIGWIEWTGKQLFELRKNPFSNHPKSLFTYVVPEDVSVPEQGLIRVNVDDKPIKRINLHKNSLYGTYSGQFYVVEGYEPLKIDMLPKPRISKEEFLDGISRRWVGEDKNTFSKELAYNILSCPKSSYGTGGIGAQSLAPYGSKKTLINLDNSIKSVIPLDFFGQNKAYIFKSIRTIEDNKKVKNQLIKERSDELSFNYLFELSPSARKSIIPTQIPVVVPDVKYKSDSSRYDRDLLDYHISMMLIKPVIEENISLKIIENIKKSGNNIFKKGDVESNVNTASMLKFAGAWCRLEGKCTLDEDDIPKIENDLKEIFNEYFDFRDEYLKTDRTWNVPLTPMSSTINLSKSATKIYWLVKNLPDESYKKINRNSIRELISAKEIHDYDFDRALHELVNANYILQFKNYTEFLVI